MLEPLLVRYPEHDARRHGGVERLLPARRAQLPPSNRLQAVKRLATLMWWTAPSVARPQCRVWHFDAGSGAVHHINIACRSTALVSGLRAEYTAFLQLPAAQLLIEQGHGDARVFEALVSVIGANQHPMLSALAVRLLIELQHGDEQAFEAVVPLLEAEDPLLRAGAARLLLEQGRGDERAFEALASVLGAEELWLRAEAAQLLIEQGRSDARAIEVLISTLDAKFPKLRFETARILIEAGRGDDRAFSALASLLGTQALVRKEAARILIEQGWGDDRAFEALVSIFGADEGGPQIETLRRYVQGAALRPDDGEHLAQLVSVQPGDDEALRYAREALVDLICEHGTGSNS